MTTRDSSKTSKRALGIISAIVIIVAAIIIVQLVTRTDESNSISTVTSEIEKKSNGGKCSYNDSRTSIGMAVSNATTNFVNISEALDRSKCKSFSYGLFIVDDDKSTSVLTLSVDETTWSAFDKYDWSAMKNDNLADGFESDGILTKLNTQVVGINESSVRYTGSADSLR